ncbi:MAG: hypothetical protein WCL39_08920, partial [Armatimonadota bacterium]
MKVGIIGKPVSGKTTLFQALSRGQAQAAHTKEPVHCVVSVPDPRFDWFVKHYNPKKIHPATIDFVDDIVRLGDDRMKGYSDEAMGELRTADAMLLVLDAFESSVPDPEAVRQEAVQFTEELGLRDLMVLENRLERIEKQLHTQNPPQALHVEKQAVQKMKQGLEGGQRYDQVDLAESEKKALSGFQLLSAKPLLVAINVGEDVIAEADTLYQTTIAHLGAMGVPAFCLSAEIEKEVAELDAAEQQAFLQDYGITEPVADKVISKIYSSCDLMTFFTVSEKEVHAWPLRKGSTALE